MPTGQVDEAELPPSSVAGVNRSPFRRAWQKAMDSEIQGLKGSKTFTVVEELSKGKKGHGGYYRTGGQRR